MRLALVACLLAACGDGHATTDGPLDHDAPSTGSDAATEGGHDAAPNHDRTVFVIPFENKSDAQIYGNTTDAPFINGLLATSAHATMFQDELPTLPSEPHYIWMEAGTNALPDHTFMGDGDATAANSSSSTDHLSTQLDAAGLSWIAYQEGIGTDCPITSTGFYAVKHEPFVFFQDVSGSPPSAGNARCAAHHKEIAALAGDLAAGTVPNYAFITPNLCHEMHGAPTCPSGTGSSANIAAGDQWLSENLQPLLDYTKTHDAVIFLVWDEGDATNLIPFLALGDHVVTGASATVYTHGSQLKTVEELLGVPVLPSVQGDADFSAMFEPGTL